MKERDQDKSIGKNDTGGSENLIHGIKKFQNLISHQRDLRKDCIITQRKIQSKYRKDVLSNKIWLPKINIQYKDYKWKWKKLLGK